MNGFEANPYKKIEIICEGRPSGTLVVVVNGYYRTRIEIRGYIRLSLTGYFRLVNK